MAAATRQSRHLPAFVLLTLADGPLHGHAIRSLLAERFPGYRADAGATYRTLAALEAAGEVAFHWETEARGPARKVYALTAPGWQRLDYWRDEIAHRRDLLDTFLERYRRAKARRKSARNATTKQKGAG